MKKLFLVIISSILFAFSANAADMRIALVVKGLGIGFFEAAAEGGEEAAKEIGGVEVIYTGPATTTAEAQIEVINSFVEKLSKFWYNDSCSVIFLKDIVDNSLWFIFF